MGTHSNVAAPSQVGGSFEGQRESLFTDLSPPKQHPVSAPLTFAGFWNAGFRRLVPVVPPGSQVSEKSSLAKRPQEIGKIPGVRGANGWHSFDWLKWEAAEDDLHRWQNMSAGIGIKTGKGLVLIDADTMNEGNAAIIAKIVEKHFGHLAIRIGKAPKAGYLLRVSEDVPYQRVDFGQRNEKGRLIDRVEILSNDRFFVAHGIHRDTGQPYVWFRFTTFEQTPVATPAQVTAFLEALRVALPAAEPVFTEGTASGKTYNQESLKGNLNLVTRAVRVIPNTAAHFPTRESYRDFGYAIKAALADHPADALALYQEWCADTDWSDEDGNGNDPATVEKDWNGMKPPFRRGAGWLYEEAEKRKPGQFNAAARWFEAPPPRLRLIRPAEWANRPVPPREWEVRDLIPRHEVTLVYGDGGVGKTLLMHQYATAAASGLSWLGMQTRPARVLCFFCEDSEDELHRRQLDICRSMGLSLQDIDENLRIVPRKHNDNLLSVWDRSAGAMKNTPLWRDLVSDAQEFRADVVIVDTIADTFGGSEIDRAQVRQFVQGCLGRLAQEISGSVIALGHPSRAGQASGDGSSGSTAWNNTVRSRLYLCRMKKAENSNIRELESKKLNYGTPGRLFKIRWTRGAFEMLAGSPPAAAGPNDINADSIPRLGDAVADAVVSVLLSHPSERLVMKEKSSYYAPKVLKHLDPDTLAAFSQDEIATALASLLKCGAVREAGVGSDSSYRVTYGFAVVPDKLTASNKAADVME
jgi:hypothetical protein